MEFLPRVPKRSKPRWFLPTLTVAVFLAGFLADAQQAPRLTFQEVLAVGNPAAGFPSGSTITAIGDVPGIDADGNVSVNVNVRDASGQVLQGLYRAVAGV